MLLFKRLLLFFTAPLDQGCRQEEGPSTVFTGPLPKHLLFNISSFLLSPQPSVITPWSHIASTHPLPRSTLHCFPLPSKTLPPSSKCLRPMEMEGRRDLMRSSRPAHMPLPCLRPSQEWHPSGAQTCSFVKLMPVILPALSFVPTVPWLLILPHVPTVALHRASTWLTALPTWDWRPRSIVYRGTRCQQSTEEKNN